MTSTDVSSYKTVKEIDEAILVYNDQIDRFYGRRGLLLGFGLPCLLIGVALVPFGILATLVFSLFIVIAYSGFFLTQAGIIMLILRSALFNGRIKNRKRLIEKLEARRKVLLEEESSVAIVRVSELPKPSPAPIQKQPEPEASKPDVVPLIEEEKPVSASLKQESKPSTVEIEPTPEKKTSTGFHYVKGETSRKT